ncbi:sensor domain-containing protein [Alkalibacillus aidingensis]|uniref:sensor domain-containing protein n=1 Tax=Alkalibacillus aidingensis TaxID=2747607 RepID=UPI001661555B|nr:diguanylate cyclase [Alkalibacillus aidingensis]
MNTKDSVKYKKYPILMKFIMIIVILLIGQFAYRLFDIVFGPIQVDGLDLKFFFDLGFVLLIVAPVILIFLKQTQHHLNEIESHEQFMESIFENMYEGFIVCDQNGNLTRTNSKISEYIDLEYDDYIPFEKWTSYVQYFDPETNELLAPNELPLIRALNNEKVKDQQLLAKSENGVNKYLSVNAKCLKDHKGRVIGAFSVSHDVTDQVETKRRIKQSEEQYRSLIELLPDAVIVQKDEKIVFANDRAREMLGGQSVEDIEGKPIYDFIQYGYEQNLMTWIDEEGMNARFPKPVEQKIVSLDGRERDVESVGVPIVFQGEPCILTIDRDITERKEIEQALTETRRQYQVIANNMNDLIAIVNKDGKIVYSSPSHNWFLGFSHEEFEGNDALSFVHPDDQDVMKELYYNIMATGVTQEAEYRIRHQSGKWLWIQVKASPLFNEEHFDGAVQLPDEILLVSRDITERKELEEQLRHMAYYDELTELPNRQFLEDHMNRLMAKSKRHGENISTLFIDLDGFKIVNDQLGHDAGDELLKVISSRFVNNLREEDFIARLGGDEFIVVLEDESEEGTVGAAQRIIESLSKPIKIKGEEVQISPSIGISMYPKDAKDMDTLINKADHAMYVAKSKGKNTYQFYRTDLPKVQDLNVNPITKILNRFKRD